MQTTCKQVILWTTLLLCAASLLLQPEVSAQALQKGLLICAHAILPSLFPFFLLSELWIRTGMGDALSKLTAPIVQRVFHLPAQTCSALVLGFLGGYPIGAATAAGLLQKGMINQKEAEQTLLFCNNAGPSFLIAILGNGVFQNPWIGIVLWFIHITAACIIGRILRPHKYRQEAFFHTTNPDKFAVSFTESAVSSISTAVRVCGFVLLFSLLTGHLQAIDTIRHLPFYPLLLGSLELAGGASMISEAPWSATAKFICCAALAGWGGLCVHGQTMTVLSHANLSASGYLRSKFFHAIFSALLAAAVSPLLPLTVNCGNFKAITALYPLQWLLAAMVPLLLLVVKITTGKHTDYRI